MNSTAKCRILYSIAYAVVISLMRWVVWFWWPNGQPSLFASAISFHTYNYYKSLLIFVSENHSMKWFIIVFNAHKHVSRVTCSIQFSMYLTTQHHSIFGWLMLLLLLLLVWHCVGGDGGDFHCFEGELITNRSLEFIEFNTNSIESITCSYSYRMWKIPFKWQHIFALSLSYWGAA